MRNCTSATYISPNDLEFDEKKKRGNKTSNGTASVVTNAENKVLQSTTDNIVITSNVNTSNSNSSSDGLKVASQAVSDENSGSSENIQPV